MTAILTGGASLAADKPSPRILSVSRVMSNVEGVTRTKRAGGRSQSLSLRGRIVHSRRVTGMHTRKRDNTKSSKLLTWEEILRRSRQEAAGVVYREAEERQKREAQERERRAAEARAKRQAEEVARKTAEQRLQWEARRRERQEEGKKHRRDLMARRAREAAEREHHAVRRDAKHQAERIRPGLDDPLGWSDATFVIGHWYARDNLVYEVVAIRDGVVDIRHQDGREESTSAQALWVSWQGVREQQNAERESAGNGIVGEVQSIAEQGNVKRVAQYLAQVGWVSLVDKRVERGPLYIVPHEERRDEIDSLFNELKRRGLPLTYAKGGGGVTDGHPAWFTR